MKWMALLGFGGLGLVALVSGLLWGWNRYALSSAGLRTQGRVVENYKAVSTTDSPPGGGSSGQIRNKYTYVSYYPVIEFATERGETVRFRGSTGSGVPEYEPGAPVEVVYDPANPHKAQMTAFSQQWLGPLVVTGVGLLLLILGIGGFFLISEAGPDTAFRRRTL